MDGYTPSARDICQRHFSDEGDNVVDWDQYDEDRPVYPLATLEYIIAYHKRHNAEADSANYRADGPRTGGHMEHAVDVGCGPGTLLPTLLAPHFLRGTLVDVHATQLRMAKRRFDSLRAATPDMPLQQLITVQASGEDLPLDDACADMVTSAEAVHWMDWGRFLAEAHRVLKPGGETIGSLFQRRLHAEPLTFFFLQARLRSSFTRPYPASRTRKPARFWKTSNSTSSRRTCAHNSRRSYPRLRAV